MKNKFERAVRNIQADPKMKMTRSATRAMFLLALAATPLAAKAAEPAMPQYKQAIACAGYYTLLHSHMNRTSPGAAETLEYKGFASDWLKLAALLRQPSDDLEKDFIAKQQDANALIMDDDRAPELKQVQSYCMTTGIARFKWDQK
jgi:hypothetical protein